MTGTDKIRAGATDRGAVLMPKWLITSVTGFVLALLATATATLWSATNEFAVMNERQTLNTKRLEKLETAVQTATSDRYTGTMGAETDRRVRELERTVDALTLRIAALEKK